MGFKLRRVHLFELNDSSWAPAVLRDTIIETLSLTLDWGRMLHGLVAPFEAFLAKTGSTEVLDVCAGAGGPARILAREILRAGRAPPRFILTDLQPQEQAWRALQSAMPGVIDFVGEPVDATKIPQALTCNRARTVINAFHHFPPELARQILADAVSGSTGIFLSEGFERNPLRFASMGPAGLPALYANPVLCSKDRIAKACLTWVIPVALAASIWDGFVSTLRVYDEEELRAMVEPLGGGFTWTYGTYDFAPAGRGYYFYGVPTPSRSD